MRRWTMLVALLLVACAADDGPAGQPDGQGGRDVSFAVDIVFPDVARQEVAGPDGTGPADVPNVVPGDVPDGGGRDAPGLEVGPAPGTFGAPCDRNTDCDTNLCVETDLGPVCTRTCVEGDCPESWLCRLVPLNPPDTVSACVPDDDLICETNGECEAGAEEREACGNCGERTRTCSDICLWGPWSGCTGEGVCPEGVGETEGCGRCASRTRVCTGECLWSGWSECTEGGECAPADVETDPCGDCGERTRTCTEDCLWGEWEACSGEGECEPGAVDTLVCGRCGQQTTVCGEDCEWELPGECVGEGTCTPFSAENRPCGDCGSESRQCTALCAWTDWSDCGDEGVCGPFDTDTVECGNCGEALRTCTQDCEWGAPGACGGEGPCGAGDQEACENCGTRTCRSDCSWGSCAIGAVDAFEENDGRAAATALTGITDNDGDAAFITANVNPSYDHDWYTVHVSDESGFQIEPWAKLGQVPAGQSYRLCVSYACDENGNPPGEQCVTVGGGATQTLELDVSGCDDECGAFCYNNGGTLVIHVEPLTPGSCSDYRVDFGG